MNEEKELLHLSVLFAGIVLAASLFIYFQGSVVAQLITTSLGCAYYVAWGIVHHTAKDRLNRLIVLEYMLIGSLIFLLVLFSLTI